MANTDASAGDELSSARAIFAARLTALSEAAGNPTLERLAAASNDRMRAARPRGYTGGVTVQRISDWRAGRYLPKDFETIHPVLVSLIQRVKASSARVRAELIEISAWQQLWTAACAEKATPIRSARSKAGAAGNRSLPPITTSLPRDVVDFVGRDRELQKILDTAPGCAVSIHTIDGMAGVGKTALAVHAAHLLADRFPDGCFFLGLHAHTPGQNALEPAVALARLLTDLGVDPHLLPDGLEARRNLWLDRVAGHRVLLVLDDARDHAQVEPLIPSGPDCLTLITSRRRLVALDNAAPLAVDVLTPPAAFDLFVRLTRRRIEDTDCPAVAALVRLCGYLPLAIVLLAGRLAHHPAWSITDLTSSFTAEHDRLGELATPERAVRAAFELSYRNLTDDQQTLFRMLGLHPGTELDAWAIAALARLSLDATRGGLEGLYFDHLLDEISPGRYRLHDLLREFAAALAATDTSLDHAAAIDGLLDYYLHTAADAERRLARHARPRGSSPTSSAPGALAIPHFADQAQALGWMRVERTNLLACLAYTVERDPARMIALTASMTGLLDRDGPWPLATHLHRRAADTAERVGDPLARAEALTNLGYVYLHLDDYQHTAALFEQALAIYRDVGNCPGQANLLINLGYLRWITADDYGYAAGLLRQAITLCLDLGHRLGHAHALNFLAYVLRATGDHEQALTNHEQALAIYRDLGHQLGEAHALNHLGHVHRETADPEQAAALHKRAHALYVTLGHRMGQAQALTGLGHAYRHSGDYPQATDSFRQALEHYHELGHRLGQAEALTGIGQVLLALDEPGTALTHLIDAHSIATAIALPLQQAHALEGIARCRAKLGDIAAAVADLRGAVAVFERLGVPDARTAERYRATLESDPENCSRPAPLTQHLDVPSLPHRHSY